MLSQIYQHEMKAGLKQERLRVPAVCSGRLARCLMTMTKDGATELDAGAEIDVGSGRPTGAQDVEESMYVCMYVCSHPDRIM